MYASRDSQGERLGPGKQVEAVAWSADADLSKDPTSNLLPAGEEGRGWKWQAGMASLNLNQGAYR